MATFVHIKKRRQMTVEILLMLSIFFFTKTVSKRLKESLHINKVSITNTIIMVLIPVGLYLFCGSVNSNYPHFSRNILLPEDGIIESITFAMYLWAALTIMLVKNKKAFEYAMICLCVFIAGEEISWGQRIIGFETSNWWLAHNTQGETNFHNVNIGGIFVWGFIILPGLLYLLLGSFAIQKFKAVKQLTEYFGIPSPKYYYALVLVVILALNVTIEYYNHNEVSEAAISILVVWFVNIELAPNSRPRYFFGANEKPTVTLT